VSFQITDLALVVMAFSKTLTKRTDHAKLPQVR
jgi:hypothetical protein